mgnify:CR=1 FL=1
MGYHQRIEFNKRILKIGKDGKEVTVKGGFISDGEIKGLRIGLNQTGYSTLTL